MCNSWGDFQEPDIGQFEPKVGPQSGGTRLTVDGVHLDIGGDVSVWLANGSATVECELTERQSGYLICTTRASDVPAMMSSLFLKIDSATVQYNGSFELTPDPVIDVVQAEKTTVRSG